MKTSEIVILIYVKKFCLTIDLNTKKIPVKSLIRSGRDIQYPMTPSKNLVNILFFLGILNHCLLLKTTLFSPLLFLMEINDRVRLNKMTILIIDDQLQDHVDYELRKLDYRVLHVLNPKLVDSFIHKFKPAMVLIRSESEIFNSTDLLLDIKNRYKNLPVLIYNSRFDGYVDDVITIVKNTIHPSERLIYDIPKHPIHRYYHRPGPAS